MSVNCTCYGNKVVEERHRFNRLAWGYTNGSRARGVIVAGMENGELDIWDPSKILANSE